MSENSNHTSSQNTLEKWSKKLQTRWNVSANQVLIILLIFACTGITVLLLKKPIIDFFTDEHETPLLFSVIYYILILPIYNIILLIYGFLFGQFHFFWQFEKKMFKRIGQLFKIRSKDKMNQ